MGESALPKACVGTTSRTPLLADIDARQVPRSTPTKRASLSGLKGCNLPGRRDSMEDFFLDFFLAAALLIFRSPYVFPLLTGHHYMKDVNDGITPDYI
jgi:hypothetical protein